MSKHEQQKDSPPQPDSAERSFEPGHVMTRKQYEDLVRQAANQK